MGIDGKSDLMHLVSNWIEFVWIEPWHSKLVTKLNQLSLNASKCSPCHFRYAISAHRIYRYYQFIRKEILPHEKTKEGQTLYLEASHYSSKQQKCLFCSC